MFQTDDTICALATPNGIGAIALIRISGTKSLVLTEQFFSKPLQDKASHTSHFGLFSAPDKTLIDEVLVAEIGFEETICSLSITALLRIVALLLCIAPLLTSRSIVPIIII